jgi:hypothetical protein
MHRPTPPRGLAAGAAGAAVVVALGGAWLGHTLEYLRVAGGSGLERAPLAGVHAYMLPVGVVLALAAALTGAHCWRLWFQLGRRLDGARAALLRARRGERVVAAVHPHAAVSPPARLVALWLPLRPPSPEPVRAGRPRPASEAGRGCRQRPKRLRRA